MEFIMQNKTNLFLSLWAVVMSTLCFGMEVDVPFAQLPETIIIQTSDNQTVEVPLELYQLSETMTNMLENTNIHGPLIPLPNVSADLWNRLSPLLPYVRDNQLDNLKTELNGKELPELSRLLRAIDYLAIKRFEGCIAQVIALKLNSEENKNKFLNDPNFLKDIELDNYINWEVVKIIDSFCTRIKIILLRPDFGIQLNLHYEDKLTIEQALFILCADDVYKRGDAFDSTSTHLLSIYKSFPESIKYTLTKQYDVIRIPILNSLWENRDIITPMLTSTAMVAGGWLWWWLRNKR